MSNMNRKTTNASHNSGVTSTASHRQRIQQMQSPGLYQHQVIQKASQMPLNNNYGGVAGGFSSDGRAMQQEQRQSNIISAMLPVQELSQDLRKDDRSLLNSQSIPKTFPAVKQSSQVRQDDAVQLKPNRAAFKPNSLQQHLQPQPGMATTTNYMRHSAATMPLSKQQQQSQSLYGFVAHGLPPSSSTSSFGGGVRQRGHNKQLTTSAPSMKSHLKSASRANVTDQHNQTNEEQMEDEFEMVDREEIFDECDEQTGIQRHQMNIGLSRHPKAINSDMFNAFNRTGFSGSGANTSSQQNSQQDIVQQNTGSMVSQMSAGRLSNSKLPINTSSGVVAMNKVNRDRQSYNDFLRSSSPQINVLSREASRSPPALANIKEAFFGSSFAGNAGLLGSGRPSAEKNQITASGMKSQGGVIRNNTFALSSVNRFRPQPSGSAAGSRASQSPIRIPQDKGPQNFKNLDIGMNQKIPDQFRADLERIEQNKYEETGNGVDTSPQQDTEEAQLTYDAPHVLATTMDDQHQHFKNQFPHQLQPHEAAMPNKDQNANVLSTDQDTIIDQDDDVAEECSVAIAEQQQQVQQDHMQGSQNMAFSTQHQHPYQAQQQHSWQVSSSAASQQQVSQDNKNVYRFMHGRRCGKEEDIQDETAIEDDDDEHLHDQHSTNANNQAQQSFKQWHHQSAAPRSQAISHVPPASLSNNNYSLLHQQQQPQRLQQDAAQSGANSLNFHSSSNSNILLASQSTTVPSANQARQGRHPLANKPRTNLIGSNRSLSRMSKTSGQPNPSINEKRLYNNVQLQTASSNNMMASNQQNAKGAVCETVEDIQESVVYTSTNAALLKSQKQRQHLNGFVQKSDPTKTPDTLRNFKLDKSDQRLGGGSLMMQTVQQQSASHFTPMSLTIQGRPTLSKKDNKDYKKLPGDITISELQSTQQPQHHTNIHLENQEMQSHGIKQLSSFSASQQVMTRSEQVMPAELGSFRSPLASPISKPESATAQNQTMKQAEASIKKAMLGSHKHFSERQQTSKTENALGRGSDMDIYLAGTEVV